eukprot:5431454-Pleurochrysis_carterae.AAC.1
MAGRFCRVHACRRDERCSNATRMVSTSTLSTSCEESGFIGRRGSIGGSVSSAASTRPQLLAAEKQDRALRRRSHAKSANRQESARLCSSECHPTKRHMALYKASCQTWAGVTLRNTKRRTNRSLRVLECE